MIDYQEVLHIHQILIEEFGGSPGIRDENALRSALDRPFSGFGETEFYPSPTEKAAAIFESIVKNHPFIDGNKRTSYTLMRLILKYFGKDIKASQKEKYDFVMAAASGKMSFEGISAWINHHIIDG